MSAVTQELLAAHKIIRNALACMTSEQKVQWGSLNTIDGVEGEGVTRATEREAVIAKAVAGEVTSCADEDDAARRQLAVNVNYEIYCLAEAAAKICDDESHAAYHGMMARIKTLTEIIFYAMRLNEESERDSHDLASLERAFIGLLS